MANDINSIQRELNKLQKRPLSIIKLSSPLLHPDPSATAARRVSSPGSGPSNNPDTSTPSPASLTSDLAHYRELFKKLHFSYLEQVSKEKFLRAIVGDPPVVVEPAENGALERELAEVKAGLQAQKSEVNGLVADLEAQGRELAARHEGVVAGSAQLAELPAEIARLEETIAGLEEAARARSEGEDGAMVEPRMAMPLVPTREAVVSRREEVERLDKEIRELRQGQAARARAVERVEGELRPLESQREAAGRAAEEARVRREMREGGLSDEVELKGRWYTGAKQVLGSMLQVDAK